MKTIACTALIGGLFLLPNLALSEPANNGLFFGMVNAGKDRASIAVALGEQAGAYLYYDEKNMVSCHGELLSVDGENTSYVATSLELDIKNGDWACPATANFSLQRTDVRNVEAFMKTDEYERGMNLALAFIAPEKDSPPPEGADVLGVELGMNEAEITGLLVEGQGFHKAPILTKREIRVNAGWAFDSPIFRPDFALIEFLRGESFASARKALSKQKLSYPVLFYTAKEGLETEYDIAKAEHIAVVLVEGKAAYIRRQLAVDESSTDAVYEALNGKYGSFPRGTYSYLHDFLGDESLSGIWWSEVGDFEQDARKNWGGAVYKSDGSVMPHASVQRHYDTHRMANDCTSLHQQSGILWDDSLIPLHVPNTCASGAFFSVLNGGWAQISVFRSGEFTDDIVTAFFDVALPAFLEKAKDDLQKSGGAGTPVVPKL